MRDKTFDRIVALSYLALVVGAVAFLAGEAHQRSRERARKLDSRLLEVEMRTSHLAEGEPARKG